MTKTKLVPVGDGYIKILHDGQHVCDLYALANHGIWRLRRKGCSDLDFPTRAEAFDAMQKWCWAVYHEMPEEDPDAGPSQVLKI